MVMLYAFLFLIFLRVVSYTENANEYNPAKRGKKDEQTNHALDMLNDPSLQFHHNPFMVQHHHQGGRQEDQNGKSNDPNPYGINPEHMAMFLQAANPLHFPGIPVCTSFDKSGMPMQMPDVSSLYASNIGMGNPNVQHTDFQNMPGVVNSLHNISQMTPEQLQGIMQAPTLLPSMGGATPGSVNASGGNGYKNWWDEKDEIELLKLVEDREYRREVVGTEELDWGKLEAHFPNRSQNALRKKYWSIKNCDGHKGEDKHSEGHKHGKHFTGQFKEGEGKHSMEKLSSDDQQQLGISQGNMNVLPSNVLFSHLSSESGETGKKGSGRGQSRSGRRADRKQWSDDETLQMARIISDSSYAASKGVADSEKNPNWIRLAELFDCSVQAAKRKYRSLYDVASQNNGNIPNKGKRQHFRKSVPYRYMVIQALATLGNEATAPQIFDFIEKDPGMSPNLDIRIMPGTKHVPRWKLQIRKVLSSDPVFINTKTKQRHETIWRLDTAALQASSSGAEYTQGEILSGSNANNLQTSSLGNAGFETNPSMAMNYPFTPAGQAAMMAFQLGQRPNSDSRSQVPQGMEGILNLVDPAMMAAMMSSVPGDQKQFQYMSTEGRESASAHKEALEKLINEAADNKKNTGRRG